MKPFYCIARAIVSALILALKGAGITTEWGAMRLVSAQKFLTKKIEE